MIGIRGIETTEGDGGGAIIAVDARGDDVLTSRCRNPDGSVGSKNVGVSDLEDLD